MRQGSNMPKRSPITRSPPASRRLPSCRRRKASKSDGTQPMRWPMAGTARALGKLVAAAAPFDRKPAPKDDDESENSGDPSGGRRRTPQRDQLIALADDCELWHDANREAYVTFSVNDHREHWPVRSRDFRMWLSGRFYKETHAAIGGQALEDGLRILEARAINDGPRYEPFVRVGRLRRQALSRSVRHAVARGRNYCHGLANDSACPVKLVRRSSMRPIPEPETDSLIEIAAGFRQCKVRR